MAYEADVVSAHRMPDEMLAYGRDAAGRGVDRIRLGSLRISSPHVSKGGTRDLSLSVPPLLTCGLPTRTRSPSRATAN